MSLTVDHIRYATGTQLASLLGVSSQTISMWAHGRQHISGLLLVRASERGIPKDVLIKGLDLRRSDTELAERIRDEVEAYLSQAA